MLYHVTLQHDIDGLVDFGTVEAIDEADARNQVTVRVFGIPRRFYNQEREDFKQALVIETKE